MKIIANTYCALPTLCALSNKLYMRKFGAVVFDIASTEIYFIQYIWMGVGVYGKIYITKCGTAHSSAAVELGGNRCGSEEE